jgi:transcriptional regulator
MLTFKEKSLHIPGKFKQENIEVLVGLICEYPFATLITYSDSGIEANHLPLSLIEFGGELYLKGHIAKVNTLWQTIESQSEVLVVFNGPNSYISPNYYPTKKENGKAVPTWNYVVVHVKGKVRFIHEAQWVLEVLEQLTSEHERGQVVPWSMSDAPESYIQKMLPAIVGVEIAVESISGQWKLSQNHPEVNQKGVVDGLLSKCDTSSQAVASMMSVNLQQGN